MGGAQVRLFDASDLCLERNLEAHEPDQGQDVRNHQRQPEGGDEHRREDRVPHDPERAVVDELRLLVGVHPDAPRVAHRQLGQQGEHDPEQGQRHPGCGDPPVVEGADPIHAG